MGGSVKDSIYHAIDDIDGSAAGGGGDGSGDGAAGGGGSSGGVSSSGVSGGGGGGDATVDKLGDLSLQKSSSSQKIRRQHTECYLPCAISLSKDSLSTTSSDILPGLLGVDTHAHDDNHPISTYQYITVLADPDSDDTDLFSHPISAKTHIINHDPMFDRSGHSDDEINNYTMRPLRVLVVDDSLSNQEMLKEFFLSRGTTTCQYNLSTHFLPQCILLTLPINTSCR